MTTWPCTEPEDPGAGPAAVPGGVASPPPGDAARDLLPDFSRALVTAAAVDDVARVLLRAVDDHTSVDAGVLLLLDDDGARVRSVAKLAHGRVEASPAAVIELAGDRSAVAQVVRDGSPHRVLDGPRESLHHAELAAAHGLVSALYVPLHAAEGVLGVLVVGTTDAPRAFRREEVETVQKLADDAALAVERARYAQQLRDVGQRELVVARVARAVRASLDPAEVLETAVRELGVELGAAEVVLRAPDGSDADIDGGRWTWRAEQPDDVERTRAGGDDAAGPDLGPDSARTALDRLEPVLGSGSDGAPDRELSVALCQRGQRIGTVTLVRDELPFLPAEVRVVDQVGVEVSAAVQHARDHRRSQVHLDQQLALARAAQALTADLRFDRVLERIVSEVVKVLPHVSATFYVYDRDERELTLSAAFGEGLEDVVGDTMGLVGLAGRVARTGVSQRTNDYARDVSGTEAVHPAFRDVVRAIAVPVRWQGDLRGVISVAGRNPGGRAFGDREVHLLEAFADLASLALHNAEAYSANSRQARIQAGFYRVSQVFSSSLSRHETLEALAQAATDALDGDFSLVVGGDGRGGGALHLEGEWGAPPEVAQRFVDDPAVLASGPAPVAALHRRVITARSVANDARLGEPWRAAAAAVGVVSELAVPVSVGGAHSAVVVVCSRRPRRWGEEELVIANNLASAARAALERAAMFEEERRSRRLAEVLADVSALLAETLKSQAVLERIVEQAAVLLEVEACTLAVVDGDGPGLQVHSAAGSDAALVVALRTAGVGGLVEDVARTKRPESVTELASETSDQVLGGEAFHSFLGVPLLHPRGHLIGVLSVHARERRTWEPAEIAALASFASSAAIAIRNAELYADVKRERDTVQTLLGSIAEGIAATDAAGRVTRWNQAAELVTGLPRDQVVGRPWRDVLGFAPEVVVEEGQSVVEARPTGPSLWLAMTASPLRDEKAVARGGWIYAFRDVSAHHTLDRLKSDFVSAVSYVLRTPLTSIYGFAQTLLRDDLEFTEADRRVFLEYIGTETERLTEIVDELLEVAHIDAGSVEVRARECRVDELLERVAAAARERSPEHRVEVQVARDLLLRVDEEKLETVLGNLVDNAVRFTPAGGDVRVVAEEEPPGTVRIAVTDRGLGIPSGELSHLFTKFYVSPTAGELAGSGLGLYVSQGLVTAMGGRIDVSSQVGSGSTFAVELPAAVASTDAARAPAGAPGTR